MGDPDTRLLNVVAYPLGILDLAELNEPELVRAINNYSARLKPYIELVVGVDPHPAVLVVATVAINDFNDLLFDCLSGRGRSAHRAARVQFEHLLNMHAFQNHAMRDRFMVHTAIGTQAASRWNPIEGYLKGKRRKAARHHQRTLLRDNERAMAEALAQYGSGFARQWHPQSVRSRAMAAGLEQEYEFFRAASSVVHGAVNAMDGSVWFTAAGPVTRIGPNVTMCPSGLAAGVKFFGSLVALLEQIVDLRALSLRSAIKAMELRIDDFCRYTNGLEEHLFAEDGLDRPPIGPVTVVLPDLPPAVK